MNQPHHRMRRTGRDEDTSETKEHESTQTREVDQREETHSERSDSDVYEDLDDDVAEETELLSTHTVLKCSTPEHQADSPSMDSDYICDSEAASPVPFLCTQDGNEGETDVVWNFYTPKAENPATSRVNNTTPLSRKSKRSLRPKVIEKQLPKRRAPKISQKNTELFQDLLELNKNLHELIAKKQTSLSEKPQSSEDDIFNETQECSPKCPRSTSRCLRKNLLSSNFGRTDLDTAIESDDSMNECLLKASQIVEENILKCEPNPTKQTRQSTRLNYKTDINFKMDHDSMDAILNSIKLKSPVIKKVKKCDSPAINNDSFDNFLGNLNESALEQLTQMPINPDVSKTQSKDWTVKELNDVELS
ncbi:ATP-dependent Clp protease proteolytic subunit [Operophtera brumata]|uniref:ATP-dependent Clp protease proteolytic subunit n=1 Tax=Operophtera brumata TaxID=104452 RepID=A0A0L7L3R5_OPEBR|nr:ATP-dependent Clp protease proteolytic subunit [Operophtera brumata]